MKLHYLRIKSSPQSSQEARKALKPLLGKEVELMIGRISAKKRHLQSEIQPLLAFWQIHAKRLYFSIERFRD